MTPPGVLIISNERDVDADRVVRELGRRDRHVVRLNSERAPEWKVSLEPGVRWQVQRGDRTLSSEQASGVWWRRPEMPPASAAAPAQQEAIRDQWRAMLLGLETVAGPNWVSRPSAVRSAECKATQLAAARQLGFDVPATEWSNDTDGAGHFIGRQDRGAIVKSVTTLHWENTQASHFMFARSVAKGDLPPAGRLASCPLAFQRAIVPKRDVRVTVVGARVLAAVTDAASESRPDWRLADNPSWSPYELPPAQIERCRDLVRLLGLRFAGIDMLVDGSGRHWFCELNPNGEWGWLQTAGLPIAESISTELMAT